MSSRVSVAQTSVCDLPGPQTEVCATSGTTQLKRPANADFALMKSSSATASAACSIEGNFRRSSSESAKRISAISRCSASRRDCSSLFASIVSSGSTKTVAPDEDDPCATPLMRLRWSARTGITKRSLRTVTSSSWIASLERRITLSSERVMRERAFASSRRIRASSGLARSSSSPPGKIFLVKSAARLFNSMGSSATISNNPGAFSRSA